MSPSMTETVKKREKRTKWRHVFIHKGETAFRAAGSLTVEAALAVPIFFLFMVTFICMMDIYGRVAERTVSLMQTAEKASVIAGMSGETSLDVIDLKKPVVYRPKYFPVPGVSLTASCRGRVHVWNGRDREESSGDGESEKDELVYVTEYGSVYHTDSGCSHLKLGIMSMPVAEAERKRNASGHKYHACEKCAKYAKQYGIVYLTEYGDKYHCSPDCSGLTRNVKLVPKSEIGDLRQCSECATHDE